MHLYFLLIFLLDYNFLHGKYISFTPCLFVIFDTKKI